MGVVRMIDYRKYVSYDPVTGVFTRVTSHGKAVKGQTTGAPDREGYVIFSVGGHQLRAHRLAWWFVHGSFPEGQIDHINGDRSDNRIENLRCVSNQENARNQRKRVTNKSGCQGVCWHKRFDKWISQIRVDGRYVYLGLFSDLEKAIEARKAAEAFYGFHQNHGKALPTYYHA
jgi:hypothetical protein